MIKTSLLGLAMISLAASPALAQEKVASNGNASLSAGVSEVGVSYGSYGNFETDDARFNFIMNNVGNNPNACITRSDYFYLQRYIDDHPSLRDAVEQDFISATFCD